MDMNCSDNVVSKFAFLLLLSVWVYIHKPQRKQGIICFADVTLKVKRKVTLRYKHVGFTHTQFPEEIGVTFNDGFNFLFRRKTREDQTSLCIDKGV